MRRSPLVLLLAAAVTAVAASTSAGQTAPGTAFKLEVPKPCVAEECRVELTYDFNQVAGPVGLEIDWDHMGAPEVGFQADSRLRCGRLEPEDPSFVEPCTDTSPPYRT